MADEVSVALKKLSEANNVFTFDMYKRLAEEPGNLFFSPISIQVILALTYVGAKGRTAEQLATGLRLPENRAVIEEGVSAVMNMLQESNEVKLDIANKMFVKIDYLIKEEFKQSAVRFKAGVEEVDFREEEKTRKIINDWVEKKTNDKIKDLIPPGILDHLTRLVLVNAIYFKGNWMSQFEKDQTSRKPFHAASGRDTNVDMMFLTKKLEYTESTHLDAQVVFLPYKGGRLSMMIILPKQTKGLADLEKKFANYNLRDTLNDRRMKTVHVYLPKFKLEYSKLLNEPLVELGITDAFSDRAADFSGISDEALKVDKVLHKAFVEVNEEGTEAAAATAVVMCYATSLSFRPPPPIIFKADHPFVFLILDRPTETVLFAGRYEDPLSSD